MTAKLQYQLVTLPEIFDHGQRRFVVPNYQRSYSWEKRQRQDLLADIESIAALRRSGDTGTRHFTGTLVAASPPDGEGGVLEIVDGQQRLTSLVVLIAELLHGHTALRQESLGTNGGATIREIFLKRGEGSGNSYRPLNSTTRRTGSSGRSSSTTVRTC